MRTCFSVKRKVVRLRNEDWDHIPVFNFDVTSLGH